MKKTLVLIFTLTSLGLNSCFDLANCVDGNGRLSTEDRHVNDFSGVISEGSIKVEISQGTTNEVIVEAESNIQDLIRTRVYGNNLVIDTKNKCIDNSLSIVVKVTAVDINRIELHGSGLITGEDINSHDMNINLSGSGMIDLGIMTDELEARISGSGQLLLTGEAGETQMRISGSGNIRAETLVQSHCEAYISGSGNMYINVSETLDVRISGSGSVRYHGDPTVTTKISGSGSVVKF